MDDIGWSLNPRPGYRLKRLEVTNWGTFDSTAGQVYSLAPEGRTALLVGQNGSGKSTLVDALLTLLVQPGVRNYNVAAGAKKRERDERTYIRGACGRSSDEEAGSVTDYLRPDDRHYSVILACFERQATGEAFTLVQVLQIMGDGEVDKTYAFAGDERSIATDLSGLSRGEKIRKQLIARGFKATTKYSEYFPWVARQANMLPKAMDVFNQTVAVKDIQSLNRFIREHMLEAHPWRNRIDSLLSHFSQLSQAHQSLVKARRQIELLEPIESSAQALKALSGEHLLYQHQLDAVDSFFRQQSIEWLRPKLGGNQKEIQGIQGRKQELEQEIEALDDTQRYFKNEIEAAGGERLRQLPHQLETQAALLASKQKERSRLLTSLKIAGLDCQLKSRDEFESLPLALGTVQQELTGKSTQIAEQRLELARRLAQIRGQIEDDAAGLEILEQQPGHLPGQLADVRNAVMRQLGLTSTQLPFVCELLNVAEDQLHWQPAIEAVLRRFALTMLVPDEHYRAVSAFIENHKLVDHRGQGQKLAYAHVGSQHPEPPSGEALHRDSLANKLRLRDEHPLADWIKAELAARFDFRCCESLEQFQRSRGMALTMEKHIKFGPQHHEKDDRPQSEGSKRFVLGWDNAQRTAELHASLAKARESEAALLQSIYDLESESKKVSRQLAAVEAAVAITDFESINIMRHQLEMAKLEAERKAIEESNDAVRVLRERLEETISRRFQAQRERDAEVAAESHLIRESDRAEALLARHAAVLKAREADGSLAEHVATFEQLHDTLGDRLDSIADISEFGELQLEVSHDLQVALGKVTQKSEPLQADIIRAMQKFLSDSPEERDDLRADLSYTDGFLGLLEQLRRDDLPRYERRFQQRLNEKVIQEIGVFYAALQCERQEIESKITTLNQRLEQLEYRSGTHMKLEPRPVNDREIRDFQSLLRESLSDHFDGDAQKDELRFTRVEKLIRRLREEERWRDKVTDVRRWFDFLARELDSVTGEERSCYEDSAGQSGGEKAKLAFTILVAAIAYQFDIDPSQEDDNRFHFVVVDEMFSKVDDRYAEYALQLFEKFGLQLLIVAPLDAKARVTEPYVGCYLHTVKNEKTRTSEVISITAADYQEALADRVRGDDRRVSTGSEASPAFAFSKPK